MHLAAPIHGGGVPWRGAGAVHLRPEPAERGREQSAGDQYRGAGGDSRRTGLQHAGGNRRHASYAGNRVPAGVLCGALRIRSRLALRAAIGGRVGGGNHWLAPEHGALVRVAEWETVEATLHLTGDRKAAAFLALTFALVGGYARGQGARAGALPQQKISYGVEGDFNSAYVWRGIVLNNRPVVQPSVWISASDVSLEIWSALNLSHTPEIGSLQTTYLALAYGRAWKNLRIEPALEGYLNRRFAEVRDPNTLEATLSVSYQMGSFRGGPMRLFASHAWDVLAHRGAYFGEAGLGYQKAMARDSTLALSLRSGWASKRFNEVYVGLAKSAVNFVGVEGSFRYPVTTKLYVRPHLEFVYTTDRRVRARQLWASVPHLGLVLGGGGWAAKRSGWTP